MSGALTIDQVDALLAGWDERLRRMDENLIALEGDPTYQMLAGLTGKRASTEGLTRERLGPALDAVDRLFEGRERLGEVIDRARAVREQLGFWGKDEKLTEITQLLLGPSIAFPPAPTPLASRTLLDDAAQEAGVVPDALITSMVGAFEAARDALVSVGRAWAKLEPALTGAEEAIQQLQHEAQSLGAGALGDMAELVREVKELRVRLARDPLGAEATFSSGLEKHVAEVERRVRSAIVGRRRVLGLLEVARGRLKEVRRGNEDAHRALDQARAEIELGAGAAALVVPREQIEGLEPWLVKIGETAQAGRWSGAEVGLGKWSEAADGFAARDRTSQDRIANLLAKRAELSGRLSARLAQLEALSSRGVSVPPWVQDAGVAAERLLARRPAPLGEVLAALDRFEADVRRLG